MRRPETAMPAEIRAMAACIMSCDVTPGPRDGPAEDPAPTTRSGREVTGQ
jgi:hypothetical protein